MNKNVIKIAILTILAETVACSTANQTMAAQVGVMIATDQVVKGNTERADRVVAIATEVAALTKNETVTTVSLLIEAVRLRIDFEKLAVESPSSVLAVNLLLSAIETELNNRVQVGQIPADLKWRVDLVASWVITAAKPYASSIPVET